MLIRSLKLLLFLYLVIGSISPLIATNAPQVVVGIDLLFQGQYDELFQGKKVALVTNHTAINHEMLSSIDIFKKQASTKGFSLVALFGPEHGIDGAAHAEVTFSDDHDPDGIPIYSLHGKTRRPTNEMLKNVDVIFYDIQDIGSRSYTYISTLFYVMEEASKHRIPVVVLDRPNPINGLVIDGPMLEEAWRSFVGYINIPYCHGMTVGELAHYFNNEYQIGCKLHVIPMKGWQRRMSFQDTGLAWIPTSPHIPEQDTPRYYPMTGILGELQIVNIGIGYTLPFKVVGAPWINANVFAKHLNAQKFPGVHFVPFHYKPFYGRFSGQDCHGVLITITDSKKYQPVATQYLIIGILKSLYPSHFRQAIAAAKDRKKMFCQVNGTEEVYHILTNEKYVVWKLQALHRKEKELFLQQRKKYLIPDYG